MRRGIFLFLILLNLLTGKDLTDTLRVRFDFDRKLVYFERWRDSVFLGVIFVSSFDEYLKRSLRERFLPAFYKERKRSYEKSFSYRGGLIPVIEVPTLPFLGESRIKISGENRISFGGRQTFYSSLLYQTPYSKMFPELKMNQELRLNVTGEIGAKTKINIEHDTRRMEGKNKISIVYTGDEDEVIRKLEGGDISFLFPSTRYTGDIPAHKGLFGLRSEGALGSLNFYLVASREQSEKKEVEFKGKASLKVDTFYDYEYARNKFFIIDTNPDILSKIIDLQLFYDDGNPYNDIQTNALRCVATIYPDFPDSLPENSDERIKAGFVLLEINKDYYIRTLTIMPYGEIPVIELNISVDNGNLGCFYWTVDGESVGGKVYEDSLVVLKLIKKRRFDINSVLYKYNLRNIYKIGERNVKIKSFRIIRVYGSYYTEYETEGECRGESFLKILGLDPDNDGEINFPYFQSGYGLIVFPTLYPFNNNKLSIRDSIIYFKEPLFYGEGGRYLMVIEYGCSVQEFFLGTSDIVEASEKVYVNGILQERGKDYSIDYKNGKLSFFNLPPDAEIKVSFEQLPFFSPLAKNFAGLRIESNLLENLKIGSSFLIRSEGTYSDKPEIGYEPFNKSILSFNLSYLKDLDFARLQTNGEVCLSFKNSNTLNNAYIDNFEESSLEQPIEIRGSYFFFAPVPYFGDTHNFIKSFPRIKNPKEEYFIRRDSIFGSQIGEEGKEKDNYLIIEVSDNNLNGNQWFGICQSLSRSGFLQLENYENLEMIFRIDSGFYDGKITFNVASYLEEDVPRRTKDGRIVGYNNLFDTEDKNGNNELEPDEDCGLDGVFGIDSLNVKEDDQNDDYDFYLNPMGTEKNFILNSEDIDFNGFDGRGNNHYFSYTLSLNSDKVKELCNNWQVLTIPLKRPDTIIGNPNMNEIRKLSIYFHNFTKPFKMRIYSIKFTGVRWQKPRFLKKGVDTLISKARVYSISNKNTPNYTSPFKVKKDIRGVYYEGSLCLEIDSIFPYDTCISEMYLSAGHDLRRYSIISFYFHKPKEIDERGILVYFRVGLDSSNFYSLCLPLVEKEGFYKVRKVPYGEDWYEIQISLDSLPLAKIKEKEDIRVRGEVSLNNVRYYALGVCNLLPSKVSYSVWFNDLRVNKPKNESGFIYGINSSFSIPKIGFNSSFNIERQNPFFSRLTQAPTSATTDNLNYSINSSLDLSKIPLVSLIGLSIPLSYNKSGSFSFPYYLPHMPDLVLKERIFSLKSGMESYNFSLRRSKSSKNPFLKYSLDAFSYSFVKRFGFSNQALFIDSSNNFSQTFSYNISPDLGIKIKDEKISFLPNNISFSLSLNDNESKRKNRSKESDTFISQPKILQRSASFSYGLNYSPISDLNIEYSSGNYFNRLGVFKKGLIKEKRTFLGVDEGFSRDIGLSYNFSFLEILEPKFSIDGSYDESRERMRGDTYTNQRRINNDFSFNFGIDLDLPELFEKLKLEKFGDYFDAINFDYNFSKGSEYPRIDFRPGLLYQFGFLENLPYDSSLRTREREYSLEFGSSFKISNISLRWSYDKNWEKNFYGLSSRQGSEEIKFPSLDITISNVEKLLPNLLSSSQINTRFERRKSLASRLTPDGKLILKERNENINYNFSPLIGWQLNFKNRMNATVNFNYNKGYNYNALSYIKNYNESKGLSISYAYSFSLKEGIKIPFLKRIKLTQDINFSTNLSYNLNENYYLKELKKTFLSRSDNYALSLSFSYQLSTYTQIGLNTSYTNSRNLLKQDKIQSVDINMWVLFRF